jgi:Na+/melibiose symporter-like transporter
MSIRRNRTLPRGVIALGFVSMFMDVSSEMIHSLLPVFLVGVLGLSTLTVGLIEGIAESTAAVTKIFAGVASDWIGKRKHLVLLGPYKASVSPCHWRGDRPHRPLS